MFLSKYDPKYIKWHHNKITTLKLASTSTQKIVLEYFKKVIKINTQVCAPFILNFMGGGQNIENSNKNQQI